MWCWKLTFTDPTSAVPLQWNQTHCFLHLFTFCFQGILNYLLSVLGSIPSTAGVFSFSSLLLQGCFFYLNPGFNLFPRLSTGSNTKHRHVFVFFFTALLHQCCCFVWPQGRSFPCFQTRIQTDPQTAWDELWAVGYRLGVSSSEVYTVVYLCPVAGADCGNTTVTGGLWVVRLRAESMWYREGGASKLEM